MLQVNVKRYLKEKDPVLTMENGGNSRSAKTFKAPIIRKGKLVVVDLAGSERIDKSGMNKSDYCL